MCLRAGKRAASDSSPPNIRGDTDRSSAALVRMLAASSAPVRADLEVVCSNQEQVRTWVRRCVTMAPTISTSDAELALLQCFP